MTNSLEALNEIAREVSVCRKCPLCRSRTRTVPGAGNSFASLMLIGEGPGRKEDQTGLPFMGSAGRKLESLLKLAGLSRGDLFITNVVKCRPPANRKPRRGEADTCYQYLKRQIDAIRPRTILLMGDTALKQFFPNKGIRDAHGRVLRKDGMTFLATYHPAASIYNPGLQRVMEADMRKLSRLLVS